MKPQMSYSSRKGISYQMSRSARKPTMWTLRKVSTRISLIMPRRLIREDILCLLWIFCFRNHYSIPLPLLRRNVSARISPRGLRRPISVDTLRRVHNVCFLSGRLKWYWLHAKVSINYNINISIQPHNYMEMFSAFISSSVASTFSPHTDALWHVCSRRVLKT